MYVNHKNAKQTFNTLVTKESPNWIIVSGGEHSGKTSFIKEVCSQSVTLFCETNLSLFYLEGFISYLSTQEKSFIKNFLTVFSSYFDIVKQINNYKYLNDINATNNEEYKNIIRILLRKDITEQTYKFATYLGEDISSIIKYVVLDNFYKCDIESYEWILHFSDSYLKKQGYIIAICDFEKKWESNKIYDIFHNVQELIDIRFFEHESDYFEVLKNNVYFDNVEELRLLSQELFEIYNKDTQLLFKTIKLYGEGKDKNDYDRRSRFLRIAHNLTFKSFKFTNNVEKLILELLALSPVFLSLDNICNILDISKDIIEKTILDLYNNDVVIFGNKDNDYKIYYIIADSIIKNLIFQNTDSNIRDFLINRIWLLIKTNKLEASIEIKLELTFQLNIFEAEDLLADYIHNNNNVIKTEKELEYINKLYSNGLNKNNIFSNIENAKSAYEFGYFETSLKMLSYIKDKITLNYSFFMLLGGVQHLLLRPEAPKTFEKAANLQNITISQKLSAINREIMSLNQADKKSALKARQLYDLTLTQYANHECNGLIELYRNTNNSYSDNDALTYTLKGLQLSEKLGNELEKYKCIHNICMIMLHQNQYPPTEALSGTDIIPSFGLVDKFFKKNPQYYHKRAYPLLDLGTYEMFKYISTGKKIYLLRAKTYYSKAQLFARSFYAKNIAEMSLLVTNTHLYKDQKQLLNSLKQKRLEIQKKYTAASIVDYRVNRKILLSLAVSAVLTKDTNEARRYLTMSKKYISGPETARYNNIHKLCEGTFSEEWDSDSKLYYESPHFVPWLISLGH